MKGPSWMPVAITWLLLLTPQGRAEETELPPPGDCTKDVWRDLSKAVGTACKTQSMSCTARMSCVDLTAQWNRFEHCIQARRTLMNRCFRGGDAEHKSVLEGYERGQARCTEFIRVQCSPPEKCQ
ncbi:hypothetical protein D7X55_02745 [Corallococcus sp. AB049A]|uniref:Novel toxin 16 domain-containing protein n=2 Tax=Corallococcus interemptor TaxID=2316720 RepID=A0A3A8QBU0_9BACT|nr:hypothetical protein D7Y23_16040 [Corallococcus sp. AB050B]RKH66107.1 hypothetical protein D7X96_22400 [Corallococcus interemptor]RKI74288.1 hypothetical protein D7X55_02745 [Corallococcus sp. AB049A]